MKEFVVKHPFITFLIVDCVCAALGNTAINIARVVKGEKVTTHKATIKMTTDKEDSDESTNDIQ